jgi:hypothetical protein
MYINYGLTPQAPPIASIEIIIPYNQIIILGFTILLSITLSVFLGTSLAKK